jgi:tRNA pseudouridine synthase 10
MSFTETGHVLETAIKIVEDVPVCDYCLGRQYAWLGTGTSNCERGRSVKLTLLMMADEMMKTGSKKRGEEIIAALAANGRFEPAKQLAKSNGREVSSADACHLCAINGESIFDRIESLKGRIEQESKELEFNTFLVGTIPPAKLVERQDELNAKYSLMHSETLKGHFNRELGKALQEVLGREVDFERPDVVFIYNMNEDRIDLQINPVFIYGRYRKLKRGIPQSRWDCSACKGKGCEECGGTGRRYPDSISEYIGNPVQKMLQGTKFKVHAAGREDVDVLMLGDGRPFVVEISEPRIRTPDLKKIRKKVNRHARKKIEIDDLAMTSRARLQELKEQSSSNIKEYHATIEVERKVSDSELRALEREFNDREIEQRTPERVAHRRSDLVRKKQVHALRIKREKKRLLDASLTVQGGTYVKELISGDDGRTRPSISSLLGSPCKCVKLDVTAIYGDSSSS